MHFFNTCNLTRSKIYTCDRDSAAIVDIQKDTLIILMTLINNDSSLYLLSLYFLLSVSSVLSQLSILCRLSVFSPLSLLSLLFLLSVLSLCLYYLFFCIVSIVKLRSRSVQVGSRSGAGRVQVGCRLGPGWVQVSST